MYHSVVHNFKFNEKNIPMNRNLMREAHFTLFHLFNLSENLCKTCFPQIPRTVRTAAQILMDCDPPGVLKSKQFRQFSEKTGTEWLQTWVTQTVTALIHHGTVIQLVCYKYHKNLFPRFDLLKCFILLMNTNSYDKPWKTLWNGFKFPHLFM